jgi:hypothetical protein
VLNLNKCVIYCPSTEVRLDIPPQIPIIHEGIVLLGAPIGNQEFINRFFKKNLDELKKTLDLIASINDPHIERYLFKYCSSYCKIKHLLRTIPPESCQTLIQEFKKDMKNFPIHLLGCYPSALAHTRACLKPFLGGLGLHYTMNHAKAAYLSSVTQSFSWIT